MPVVEGAGGFVPLYRKLLQNEFLKGMDRRGVFLTLLLRAQREARTVVFRGQKFDLQAGELVTTQSDLCKELICSRKELRTHLHWLEEGNIIRTKAGHRCSIITICNWATYQLQGPTKGQVRANKGPTEQEGKESKKDSDSSLRSESNAREARSAFAEWWLSYPHKVGKGAAEKAYAKALKLTDAETLLEGVRRYCAAKPPDRAWCNPATWLNQRRWEDQPAATPVENGHDRPKRHWHDEMLAELFAQAEDRDQAAEQLSPDDGRASGNLRRLR